MRSGSSHSAFLLFNSFLLYKYLFAIDNVYTSGRGFYFSSGQVVNTFYFCVLTFCIINHLFNASLNIHDRSKEQ